MPLSAWPPRKFLHILFTTLLALLLAFLAHLSWLRWPDPWVDFGYFLYNAWRISDGAQLGTEISYHYGPLSIYFFGWLFHLFGPSIILVFVVNFVFLIADIYLIGRIFSQTILSRYLSSFCFVGIFSFCQYLYQGNYNLIGPYKPDISVGTFLVLLSAWLAKGYEEKNLSKNYSIALGISIGASLLTSTEFALASIGILVIVLLSNLRKNISYLMLGILIPLASMFSFLVTKIPTPIAIKYTFRVFNIFKSKSLIFHPLLANLMGIDSPLQNSKNIIENSFYFCGLAFLFLLIGNLKISRREKWLGYGLLLVGMFAFMRLFGDEIEYWIYLPQIYPVAVVSGLVLWALNRRKYFLLGIWSAISGALLLRMFLHPILHYYGFTLGMPVTLLLVYLFAVIFPQMAEARGYNGFGLKLFIFTSISMLGIYAYHISQGNYVRRNFVITSGKNPLIDWQPRITPRGPAVQELLLYLQGKINTNDLLLGLPDGHIINYLLKVKRPEPYSLSVGDLSEYGESTILDSVKKARPRYVFVSEKEYYDDSGGFGETYGLDYQPWLSTDYHVVKTFGPKKIKLYEHN